jgi:hypothetical protein
MAGNSLQAILDRRTKEAQAPISVPAATNAPQPREGGKGAREGTKLIGGHFPPEVSVQLRILAAEEGTTVQNLLAEALDDLFVKKGRTRVIRV